MAVSWKPHQKPRIGVGPGGRQVYRFRKWQKIGYVTVDQVHFFGDVVPSQLLVELEKRAGLEGLIVLIKGPSEGNIWRFSLMRRG